MSNMYQNNKSGATATRTTFFNSLRKLFLLFITIPLLHFARAQAPHITSFHPTSAGQGDTVTITGTHLDSLYAVTFGGVSAQSFTVFSDSLVWAIVGTGASGKVKVFSTRGIDSLAGFTYILHSPPPPLPLITSFIPDSARQNDTVLIRGLRFTGATGVSFGGVPAQSFHVLSDSAMWAVVGSGASGNVIVSRSPYSGSRGGFIFIAPPPAQPHLVSFFPDSARHGDTVSLRGTHFSGVTAVSFGGVPAQSFTILSDSLIWAIVGTGATGYVKVTHSPYSDSLSGFIYIPPTPPSIPHIISFTPDSARQNDTVLIRGIRFTGATSVSFGGVPASSFYVISDSVIGAVVGSGASGNVRVSRFQYSDTLAGFRFIASPPVAPHVISFTPDSARQNDTVLIRGIRFTGATAVSFGGIAARSFTVLSDSAIWAVVDSGASGSVRVSHFQYSDTLAGFIFIAPPLVAPHLIAFTPTSAGQWDTVSLRGTHLSNVTAVTFGGVPAYSFTTLSDSLIWAIVGTGASGKVKVFTAQSSDSLNGFTYILQSPPPIPHITSFTPDSARQNDTVLIRGIRFTGATAVSFGGVSAQSYYVISDSAILAIVGSGASGSVTVIHSPYSDSLGGFRFISSDTTMPPPPPPPPSFFKLVSFTGASASSHVSLLWSVKFDESIFFYSVEHSTDTVSSHFVSIGGVAAQKLDSADYTFADTATRTGVNYYQLRIVDSVGSTTFSGRFAIDLGNIPGTLSLYPNPAVGRIFVTVPSTWLSSRFLLTNSSGQVVLTVPVRPGVQQVIIPVGRFNKGVYKLMWTNGQNTATRTILILK